MAAGIFASGRAGTLNAALATLGKADTLVRDLAEPTDSTETRKRVDLLREVIAERFQGGAQ